MQLLGLHVLLSLLLIGREGLWSLLFASLLYGIFIKPKHFIVEGLELSLLEILYVLLLAIGSRNILQAVEEILTLVQSLVV